jgi:hypothetical protein
MNRYNNVVGYYNPKETERVQKKVNSECVLQFDDTSWHNDEVDSLHCELENHTYFALYLPHEEFKEYFLTNEVNDELLLTESLEEVINYLNK